MNNIIIFASGSGCNAETIINYFKNNNFVKIVAVLTNKANAGVIDRANKHGIPSEIFSTDDFQDQKFLKTLLRYNPDLFALAGFLLKVPEYLIKAFPNKIINIHPALLPNYGGRGMY